MWSGMSGFCFFHVISGSLDWCFGLEAPRVNIIHTQWLSRVGAFNECDVLDSAGALNFSVFTYFHAEDGHQNISRDVSPYLPPRVEHG